MWYEVLPSLAIIAAGYVVPMVVPYYVDQMIYGNPMRRNFTDRWTCVMTERDNALAGDYRNSRGLEVIPDKK